MREAAKTVAQYPSRRGAPTSLRVYRMTCVGTAVRMLCACALAIVDSFLAHDVFCNCTGIGCSVHDAPPHRNRGHRGVNRPLAPSDDPRGRPCDPYAPVHCALRMAGARECCGRIAWHRRRHRRREPRRPVRPPGGGRRARGRRAVRRPRPRSRDCALRGRSLLVPRQLARPRDDRRGSGGGACLATTPPTAAPLRARRCLDRRRSDCVRFDATQVRGRRPARARERRLRLLSVEACAACGSGDGMHAPRRRFAAVHHGRRAAVARCRVVAPFSSRAVSSRATAAL